MDSTSEDVGDDGFTRHRCSCRHRTVLGSHGFDTQGRYVYKVLWRDRIALMYFGVVALRCRHCERWCRVRILPREKRAEFVEMARGFIDQPVSAAIE